MNFNELKRVCEINHIPVTKLAIDLGLSYSGLKRAMMQQSLSMRNIVPLCDALSIDPNKFFGFKTANLDHSQTQYGGHGNTQYMDSGAIDILRSQLLEKDRQIAEKDTQIKNLISLITKK